ncbi:hypothetical protein ACFSQJ_05240 [Croceitalea marina]|uniref:Carbohydrate-binding family 6 protein n=1 Tax=Croceitalea marina TaxID=1775166 RepID=A0ABW5MVE2_9FLAO
MGNQIGLGLFSMKKKTIAFVFLLLGISFFLKTNLYAKNRVDIDFAKQRINSAVANNSEKFSGYTFHFKLDSINLVSQAFKVRVDGKQVNIYGGDGKGLLYGGLEVAEQIEIYKIITDKECKPFLEKRGIKFNIPLDARTPSYDDSGDAAQRNILEMWSWEFWEEFIDDMAIHRYNTLSLWNPHPFPSMIKLPDYPDIALDDVKVTTLKPLGRENEWGDPQLVTTNVMQNLKTVKKITIDEKIAFWKKVMAHAKKRGIDVYWITWNICPNSVANPVEPYHKTFGRKIWEEKPGKYGISHQINNKKTIAYYREAVKIFLLTYPDVKGIGVTAGEYMPPSWEGYNREQWLWETYGLGIIDAKAIQPKREVAFIHRVWYSDMDQIMKYFKNYPDSFEVSFKYAKARLFSITNPPFANSHLETMKSYNLKSWWNLRNDDIFVYRWGDSDYVREFLRHLPKKETAGYYYGSDGYVWGREFISKSQELSGELEIKKHWYNFMLWGRLGYENDLSDNFFERKIEQHHKGLTAKELKSVWESASRIIPKVNSFHWRDWDHLWSPEACLARPVEGGFRRVTDFMDNPTVQGGGMLNPNDYVKAKTEGLKISYKTPLDVSEELRAYAKVALMGADKLEGADGLSSENKTLLDDIKAMGHLGNYYADKIDAAVALAFYMKEDTKSFHEEAISLLETAVKHWKKYAEVSSANYRPQMLARTNLLDWNALTLEVVEDLNEVKAMR